MKITFWHFVDKWWSLLNCASNCTKSSNPTEHIYIQFCQHNGSQCVMYQLESIKFLQTITWNGNVFEIVCAVRKLKTARNDMFRFILFICRICFCFYHVIWNDGQNDISHTIMAFEWFYLVQKFLSKTNERTAYCILVLKSRAHSFCTSAIVSIVEFSQNKGIFFKFYQKNSMQA